MTSYGDTLVLLRIPFGIPLRKLSASVRVEVDASYMDSDFVHGIEWRIRKAVKPQTVTAHETVKFGITVQRKRYD